MSSKKSNYKNARQNKKPKFSNCDAEVFVLPPNLLEKLGIHLGSIESTRECPTGSGKDKEIEAISNGYHTIPEEIPKTVLSKSNNDGHESSFLETADLMKKSVFLSPTFNPVVNVIPEGAELTGFNNFADCSPLHVEFTLKNDTTLECNAKVNSSEHKIKDTLTETNSESRIDLLDHVKENHNENKISTKITDDFIDEAYSTDGSNSNFESFNSDSILQIKPKQKINIISQEVPDSSQLKEIKNLFTPLKNSFIPVSMDTIITGKKYDCSITSDKNTVCLQNLDGFSDAKPETEPETQLQAEISNTESVNDFQIAQKTLNTSLNNVTDHLVSLKNPFKNTELCKIEPVNHTVSENNDYEYNNCASANYYKINKDVLETSLENEQNKILTELAAETMISSKNIVIKAPTRSLTKGNITENLLFSPETDIPLPNSKNEVNCYLDVNINNNINIYEVPNAEKTRFNNSSVTNDFESKLIQNSFKDTKDQIYIVEKDNLVINNSAFIYPDTVSFESSPPTIEDVNDTLLTVIEIDKAGYDNLDICTTNNFSVSPISSGSSTEFLPDNEKHVDLGSAGSEKSQPIPNRDQHVNVPGDKVKEIAMYLKQLSHCSEQNKQKNTKLLTPKRDTISSKLCVQGVEKPGGCDQYEIKFDHYKVHKKYNRLSVRKSNLMSSLPCTSKTPPVSIISAHGNQNVDIDSVISKVNTKIQEFCLCHDFGRLTYYDSDVSYEHLHFWWNRNLNCEIETLFDIYYDNEEHFNDHKSDSYRENNYNNSESDFNICWHVFKCGLDKYVADDIAVENIEKYNDHDILNNDSKLLSLKVSANDQENYSRNLFDTKRQVMEHNMNVDLDDNSEENDSIGDNRSIEIVVEISDNLNEPLNKFSENLKPNSDDKIEENVNTNTDIMDVTTNPRAETITDTSGEKVEITSDDKAINRKSNVYDNINITAHEDVMDVAINPRASTIAVYTSGETVEVEITSDADDNIEENMTSNANVIDVTIKRSADTTADTSGETDEVENTSDADDNIEENMTTNANVIDVTIKRSADTTADTSGETDEIEITNDADDNIEENMTSNANVIDVTIKRSADTTADTSGETDEVENTSDADDNIEENMTTNADVMDVTINPSVVTTADTPDETVEVEITNENKTKSRKRKMTLKDCLIKGPFKKNVKCNVCELVLSDSEWQDHVSNVHCYVAWKDGQTMDFQDPELLANLKDLEKKKSLKCTFCDVHFKYLKKFLRHVQKCMISKISPGTDDGSAKVNSFSEESEEQVKCGVCKQVVDFARWLEHISKEHHYLAWKDGDQPVDLQDESAMKEHLYNIVQTHGALSCAKCGLHRNYTRTSIKYYLDHIQTCGLDDSHDVSSNDVQIDDVKSQSCMVKCAVCKDSMKSSEWFEHLSNNHNYLAWKDGEDCPDLNDENSIRQHLLNISREAGSLVCSKCGLTRKYPKAYLQHITFCGDDNSAATAGDDASNVDVSDDVVEEKVPKCGICHEVVVTSAWMDHIAKQHNYMAWKEGETPLDLNDNEIVRQHLLNIVKQVGKLICSKCGFGRKYPKSYLQHIKECTEQRESPNDSTTSLNSTIKSEADQTLAEATSYTNVVTKPTSDTNVVTNIECAVCHEKLPSNQWISHSQESHNYAAWRTDEPPLDLNDNEIVRQHLLNIVKQIGKLICSKCGFGRKYPKSYLQHIKECTGQRESANDSTTSLNSTIKSEADQTLAEATSDTNVVTEATSDTNIVANVVTNVECAVCNEKLQSDQWISHSQEIHNYAAWRTDEPPLDTNNEYSMSDHLKNIVKEFGNVICNKCSRKFKYVKTYLQHVKHCTGLKEEFTKSRVHVYKSTDSKDGFIVCGVCEKIMRLNRWINHIQTEHNYLAWKDGQFSIDLNNPDAVHSHLQGIIDRDEPLICCKCGITHDDAALYLEHVKSCKGDTNYDPNVTISETLQLEKNGLYKCAICSESVSFEDWRSHAMDRHYNIAWVVGDEPLDIKSPYGTAKNLKEYLVHAGKFRCKTCGITRASSMGFYAHIIVCGKTEQEINKFQIMCQICDSKYLCIYRSQHMTMHVQQEIAKEHKVKTEMYREKEMKRQMEERTSPAGRRKAAQKAQSVIEDYNKSMSEFKYSCESCTFGTDVQEQLTDHVCTKKSRRMSDSSPPTDLSESSNDDNIDSDSDASGDDSEPNKKQKRCDRSKTPRLPFTVASNKQYIVDGFREFSNQLYSSETLFPQWRICKYKLVPEDQISEYMPRLEQSCKVIEFSKEPTIFKRFEAKKEGAYAVFVGASIECMSWAPPHASEEGRSYLAVATHAGADCPRYGADDLVEHAALIQIWDFGHFDKTKPELALGLAHDYGTVWAMDWCPSGARDSLPQTNSEEELFSRIGLLSVACSNGYGYIFSVPYPWTIKESDKLFYKLKPVVKLKFSMNSDRKMYQASSICWSKEKGHNLVIVGYANGSVAFYDLNTESPFLRTEEDEVTVLYPYYDERSHTTCITALSTFPGGVSGAGVGALGAASPSGASCAPGAGAARARARAASSAPCAGASFAAAWPNLLPAGDDANMNLSTVELEYTGYGRRVGLLRASGGCERCGHTATHAGQYVRLTKLHPVYGDVKRQMIAIIKMKQLGKKRKLVNDELAIKAEPLRYEEAISRYGLYINVLEKKKRNAGSNKPSQHNKEMYPDRFPLADVTSMAFCPSAEHHTRLAIATYAGFVIVIKV